MRGKERLCQTSLEGDNIDVQDGNDFGDSMGKKDERTLRIVFQNVCSLSESKATSKSNQITEFVINNEVDVMMMAEVGLRWDKVSTEDLWSERVFGKYNKEKHIFAYNKNDGESKTAAQVGGTGISVTQDATYRVVDKGSDTTGLGRWCWVRLRGRNQTFVRMISVYRPCNSSGPLTVASQHRRFLQSNNCFDDPRDKILEDLKRECEKWKDEGDLLVIGIDANEDTRSPKLRDFCTSLGLTNAILDRHKHKSPPATYNRNNKREPIDAIWVSAALQPCNAGFLGFDCGIPSDHRALWIDLPFTEVFGYAYPPMDCGSRRKLNSKDPRLVKKYCDQTRKLLIKEDIPRKIFLLEQTAHETGWNAKLEEEYNFLHRRNIQIRQQVEKNIRKFRAGAVPWSPKLQVFRDTIQLWAMIKKKRMGIKTSTRKIRRLMKKVKIFDALSVQLEEASSNLDTAFKEYKIAKSQAPMWRDDFLHNLAAARAKAKGTDKKGELKSLIQVRRQKKQAAAIKRIRNKMQDLSCYKIQVGEGEEVRTVDQKAQIERAFIEANVKKFSQTMETPPMSNEMKALLGEHGETDTVQSILDGTFAPNADMDPLLAEFLCALKRPNVATAELSPNQGISTETHREGWAKQKEAVSAEPTGLSFSHYKAAINDDFLASMDAVFRSLPFQHGFAPEAWMTITDVQILKKAGIYHVDKMRTIMLMHAEFNMNNKLIGKSMMEFAERFYLLAIEQFGSRKYHHATAAALNKRLTFDILRQKRLSGAICANDAKSCYDRIVHNIAAICMMRAGAPKEAVWSMFQTLKRSIHYIKTAFGVSKESYTSTESRELQGIGQGNGCGPAAWAAISTPIIHLMKRRGHGLKFTSAISNMITEFVAYAFVDDTDLVTSASNIMEDAMVTLEGLQRLATDWDDALFLTGGAVVPNKSHWTMIAFKWRNDKWDYCKATDIPGDILLKDPISRNPIRIKRLEASDAEETLGVFISGDGNNKKQYEKLLKKSQIFGQCIKSGKVSKYDVNYALRSTILKTMEYPLIVTNLKEPQWTKILCPAIRSSLPRMGFVRTLPKELVHGPVAIGGLEIPHMWHRQHLKQIQYVIEEVHNKSIARNLIITTAEQFFLEVGLDEYYLDWPMHKVVKYTTDSWWKSLLEYCYAFEYDIRTNIKLPQPVNSDDRRIMSVFLKLAWKPREIRILNECRMALKVTLVSEITLADGKTIAQWAWEGRPPRKEEMYQWAKPAPLSSRHWRLWKKALSDTILQTNTSFRELRVPIRIRRFDILLHQQKQFWMCSFQPNRLYLRENGTWIIFYPTVNRRRLRRISFNRSDDIQDELPPNAEYASVDGGFDQEMVTLLCSDEVATTPVSTSSHTSFSNCLEEILQKDTWIWKEIKGIEHAENLANSITNRKLYAISDGSYLDGFGTSASVLCDQSGMEIWAQSITPGAPHYQHSQRSELAGIAASLALVEALCVHFNISEGEIVVGLDGKQAIQNVRREKARVHLSDYDFIHFIQNQIDRLPITVNFLWIPGHQDDLLPWHALDYPAQMNVLADRYAKQFLVMHMQSTVPITDMQFSTEQWCLVRHDVKFSRVNSQSLYEDTTTDQLIRYWARRGNIPDSLIREIDWDNYGIAFSRCTFAQRRRLVKLSSGHAPVGKMMFLWRKQNHSRCPLCDAPSEDVHHMLTCQHVEAQSTWHTSIDMLDEVLTNIHTDPEIIRMTQCCLRQWRRDSNCSPRFSPSNGSWKLARCRAHQTEIGWENLIKGRISIWWEICQDDYLQRTGLPFHSHTWAQKFIKVLWELMWKAWDTRNYTKHHTLTTERQNEINELHQNITTQFNLGTQDLVPGDHSLLDITLDDLLECTWDYKTRWLQSVTAGRRRYSHQQQNTQRNLNPSRDLLRNWLYR